MKRFSTLLFIFFAAIVFSPVGYSQVDLQAPGLAEDPEAIVIRDTHLSTAIRSTLGLAEDATLTATDMLNLRSLEAKEAEISDLSGLEHATNLTTLNLYRNQLTDLSPISGLEGLLSLDLGKNTITNIEALKGLTALTILHLDGNQPTDFRPLSSLTNLGVLHLNQTGISDLSVLGSLTKLAQLYLTGNAIRDIGALSGLTEMGWLFLAQNQISDVSPLVGMEALVSLRLLGNPVSNASVLYRLTQGRLIDVDIEIPPPPPDTEPPSVSIAVPSDPQNSAFEVTITFSEAVSNFEQADVTLSGTAIASITGWLTPDDTVFTATITPTTSGEVGVNVMADVATDAASNNNTASDSQTVTVDITPPEVSISVPEGVWNSEFNVVITFTESVSDFERADVTLSGTATASIGGWSTTDDTVFTVKIIPTTSGDVVVSVMADVATDAASNNNTASDSQTVTVDMTSPDVRIFVPEGVQNGAFNVTIIFSESVSDFEQSDLFVSGTATVSITAWQGIQDTIFIATITPTTSGTLTLSIAEGAVTDTAGNTNVLSTAQVSITTDDFVSVCDRTPDVRNAIVAALPDVHDCADVTAADLATIKSIRSLTYENITALKEGDFNGLTALKGLDLRDNALVSLPSGIFDNLTDLEGLDLSDNDLGALPSGIFDKNTDLEGLDLSGNDLGALPSGIFDNNTDLESIVLGGNDLGALLSGIFDNNTDLVSINLRYNDLGALPSGIFDNNTVLRTLYLDGNDLGALPSGIFDNNTVLRALYLDGNDLDSLPEGIFNNLTALMYLHLSSNDLDSLPEGIFNNLTVLTGLHLSNNDLSSLPEGVFKGLTALEKLSLGGNTVDPLPLTVSLKRIEEGQFKATVPTGAPFDIVLPLTVTNGSIDDGGTPRITISTGTVESESVTVSRTPGTVDAVWVDIGTLPGLPNSIYYTEHSGYALVKSSDLPLTVIEGPGPAAPGIAAEVVLPNETTLSANYPNPFNPETWIPYQLSNPSDVVISIYDSRGQVVRRLELGHQSAGYYINRSRAAYWDGRNDMGERVSSGLYFYHMRADTLSLLRKMVILK